MKKVIVKLEDFGKSYGKKEVIKNINLEIYEGEFLTLLGSSGCGKTTILRSISGLDVPTSGRVYIDSEDVTNLEPPKRQVNTIFQKYEQVVKLKPQYMILWDDAYLVELKDEDPRKKIGKESRERIINCLNKIDWEISVIIPFKYASTIGYAAR